MPILEMKVPSPGESISEVEIAAWLVSDGDYVFKDQAIAEVDSDKATLELPAEMAGTITLKADEKNDNLHMVFENGEADRVSDFEMKLMDIDSEHLGIPDTEYKCVVKMSAKEFSKICRDLGALGDTCSIDVSKDGIKFSVAGDIGTGRIIDARCRDGADRRLVSAHTEAARGMSGRAGQRL